MTGSPTCGCTNPAAWLSTGCEPVIRIVKQWRLWRLSPVACRRLSTTSVLHLEDIFEAKTSRPELLVGDGRQKNIFELKTQLWRCGWTVGLLFLPASPLMN